MNITVNGEPRHLDGSVTVADLVDELDLSGRRIAVEVNEELVPRSTFSQHRLEDGDRIEIVHAIGGG
jgi:sulfur carrier protein